MTIDVPQLFVAIGPEAHWQVHLMAFVKFIVYLMGYGVLHRMLEHSTRNIFALVDSFLPQDSKNGRLLVSIALLACYIVLQYKYATLFATLLHAAVAANNFGG